MALLHIPFQFTMIIMSEVTSLISVRSKRRSRREILLNSMVIGILDSDLTLFLKILYIAWYVS